MTIPFMPGISPTAFARRSDCLLSFDCADGVPTMRSGQAMTFARASLGTIIDARGRVVTIPNHLPRVTYGGAAFDQPGYLAEAVSTNRLLYSANPLNGYWGKTNLTVTSAAVHSPDYTTIAQKCEETAINGAHAIASTSITVNAGYYSTFSVFVRPAERSRVMLNCYNAGNGFQCVFRLDLLTKTTILAGTGTVQDTGIQALGDGWYRVWLTGRAGAAITSLTCEVWLVDAADATSYLGVAGSGAHVWGLDHQEGSTSGAMVMSHIPTTTATVARSADVLSITPGFVIPENFTLYAKVAQPLWWNHTGVVPYDSIAQGGSTSPRWELNFSTAARTVNGSIYDGTTIPISSATPILAEALDFAVQYADVHTLGARSRIDGGAGFGAQSARVTPITDIGATRLTGLADKAFAPGNGSAAALQSLRMVSGLRTLTEIRGRR